MRLIRFSVLSQNPLISTEVKELLSNEFASLVITLHLNFASKLILSICFVPLERHKCITFLLQESNCSEPGLVINEGLPVPVPFWGRDRQRAFQIGVHKCKE
jgi:hypothetical protein